MNVSPRLDDLEDAVHVGGVDTVEVDRVRMLAAVREPDTQRVSLRHPDDRARNGAVVRPGGERDALRDLDLRVDRGQLVVGARTERRWIQEPVQLTGGSRRRHPFADHGGVARSGVVVAEVRRLRLGRRRLRLGQRELHERDRGKGGRRSDQELTPRHSGFRHV